LISRTQAQPQWSQQSQPSQRADPADLKIASIKMSISHSIQTGGMELLTTNLLSSLQYFVRPVSKVMRTYHHELTGRSLSWKEVRTNDCF
jgi:hypothetical protein